MKFDELQHLARETAKTVAVPWTENADGLEGWMLNKIDTRDSVMSTGGRGGLEFRFEADEVWLTPAGELLLVQATDPGGGRPRTITSSPLPETYARKIDGDHGWDNWEEIGGFVVPRGDSRHDRERRQQLEKLRGSTHKRDVGERYWKPPTDDQTPFSRVAGWLADIRP
jgi:hypothetical protein